jgi:TnpA family transposase
VRAVREHWDDVARLVTSFRQGTVNPSLLVGKLAGHPRQNHLFVALREIGRIERSLFTLEWLQNPELRRRVTIGLNKGEAHHTLKRAIRFYRRGSVGDRTQLNQDLNAMALNLVVAAIILWNTAYLDHALQQLQTKILRFRKTFCHISRLWAGSISPSPIDGKERTGFGEGSNPFAGTPSSS